MPRSLRVGIAGCGTAGPAVALFLARAGHRVEAFERAANPGAVGAGVLLQPTGLHVLHRLGLLDELLALGAPVGFLHGVTRRGRVLMNFGYEELQPGLFGLGIHRGALFRTLFQQVTAEGVSVSTGVRIVETAMDGAARTLIDDAGNRYGPYDLVVVADGARSLLRGATHLTKRSRAYEWAALWFIAEDPDRRFAGRLFQVYDGTRRFAGFLPTGSLEAGGSNKVSFFWSLRRDQVDAWRTAGLAAWKQQVLRVTEAARPVLDQIEDPDQVLYATYTDAVMRQTHEDGLVYLGDAAHAMSPQLGQGVNLALLDAMVLAESIEREATLSAALSAYTEARRAHVSFYQYASRWLLPLFQSDLVFLGPLRDWFVRPIASIPFLRRHMLHAMAGTKTGWWTTMDLPGPPRP